MTYTYGMKGAPAVGNGLGGLPRRVAPQPTSSLESASTTSLYPILEGDNKWITDTESMSTQASNMLAPFLFEDNKVYVVGNDEQGTLYDIDPITLEVVSRQDVSVIGGALNAYSIFRVKGEGDVLFSGGGELIKRIDETTLEVKSVTGYTGTFCGISPVSGNVIIITTDGLYYVDDEGVASSIVSIDLGASSIASLIKSDFGFCVCGRNNGYLYLHTLSKDFTPLSSYGGTVTQTTGTIYSRASLRKNVLTVAFVGDEASFIHFELESDGNFGSYYLKEEDISNDQGKGTRSFLGINMESYGALDQREASRLNIGNFGNTAYNFFYENKVIFYAPPDGSDNRYGYSAGVGLITSPPTFNRRFPTSGDRAANFVLARINDNALFFLMAYNTTYTFYRVEIIPVKEWVKV